MHIVRILLIYLQYTHIQNTKHIIIYYIHIAKLFSNDNLTACAALVYLLKRIIVIVSDEIHDSYPGKNIYREDS